MDSQTKQLTKRTNKENQEPNTRGSEHFEKSLERRIDKFISSQQKVEGTSITLNDETNTINTHRSILTTEEIKSENQLIKRRQNNDVSLIAYELQ